GRAVQGVVEDERGVAVVGATVVASGAGQGDAQRRAVSDQVGRFRVGPLPDGVVSLVASAPGHGTTETSVPAAADRRGAAEVVVVLVRADAVATGRLNDPAGRPVADATLELVGGTARTRTDPGGRYRLAGLTTGRHRVRLRHPDAPGEIVTVTTGRDEHLVLAWGGGVSGLVRDRASGAPISGAVIEGHGPGDRRSETRTDGDGAFTLAALAEGRWRLRARHPGHVAVEEAVDVTAAREPGQVTVRDLRIELGRGATIAGLVRDASGE